MSKNELIERDGAYFQEATTMSFTDSHWTIVTNLSLEEINEQLRNVEKWLKEYAKNADKQSRSGTERKGAHSHDRISSTARSGEKASWVTKN